MGQEEYSERKREYYHELFLKILPYTIVGLVILLIGLSMIGSFFELRLKVDGEKIDTVYKLTDMLFSNPYGTTLQTYFIVLYLVIPLLASIFLLLGKIHQNFIVPAILLYLLGAITMILSKDVVATSLSETTGEAYSIHDTYFSYMLPIIIMFIASFLSLVLGTNKVSFTVKDLTEMGMLIALALALNFIKIVQLGASGGSINFQMLPLFILALRRGPLKGFLGAGVAYGLISCLTDGYGIATFPFDYLLGMGSTCIIGFFSPLVFGENQKTYNVRGEVFLFIGAALSTMLRFVGGCASSMIIYGYNIQAAMAYNALYVFISGAVAIGVIMAIYGPFIKINKRYPAISKDNNMMDE